jgi:tetratricopeptide (TPR) repeat protein
LVQLGACAQARLETTPATHGLAPEPPWPGDHYAAGRAALARGEPGLAVERFRRALRADPFSADALNGLAVAYDELGRFDVARSLYDRALGHRPDAPATLNNLGRSLLRQGAAGAALAPLGRARDRAGPADLVVIDSNLAAARARLGAGAAAPSGLGPAPGGLAAPTAVERVGARLHLLRTGAAGPQIPRPAAPAAGLSSSFTFEVTNGTGRNRMAARLAALLGPQLGARGRLTNADNFEYASSTVHYRKGCEADAARVANLLPVPVVLTEADGQDADVRLLLGRDLLGLDDRLLGAGLAG